MTTEQRPSGVAQRLITECGRQYQNAKTDEARQAHGNQVIGMTVMHDELSREAQQIITNHEKLHDNAVATRDWQGTDLTSIQLEALREAFQGLGLDIEEAGNDH